MKKILILTSALFLTTTFSCEDFLETTPVGVASDAVFYNEKGINALLTGAYALIDGVGAGGWGGEYSWPGSVTNWVWGSVASDDSYKGTSVGDQSSINPVERYETLVDNDYVSGKWTANYDGVARTNDVLKVLAGTPELATDKATQFEAEARFLRAWYHFEMKRVFNNIPYITDVVEDPATVPNTADAWPSIESDLQFGVGNLPGIQGDVGRPTKYAAMAVLARAHLFQQDYSSAADVLDDIIGSGNYSLMPNYFDNYMIANNNNVESIFEIQYAVNDGTPDSFNGGYGDCLNFPHGGDIGTCCGFHQPSQNLVNAFKVDDSGLPLLDSYNDTDLKNDQMVDSDATFEPFEDTVDPRLDWTVGRRGIPFLDWGIMRGADWIREQPNGGPYLYKKNMFYSAESGSYQTSTGWATGVNANNYRAYRYAHVLLWRAECYIEAGDLTSALDLVNEVRERAGNAVVMGKCTTYELPQGVAADIDLDQPAANYDVQPYSSFPSQDYARKAVQMELRLEFGMEGHRFFDLVRWGIADDVLNDFIARDTDLRGFMTGANFDAGKDEYWPIPQNQIDQQGSDILQQNPGY
jgi:hypothetical protein|tara:strand:+ start:2916 stop:4658 length:1743 start_codon:yes stop_codon:yes gene_type:complete